MNRIGSKRILKFNLIEFERFVNHFIVYLINKYSVNLSAI